MTRELSSPTIKNINGYEIMKHELARKEKVELTPIEIVYEPIFVENVQVLYYFTDKIHCAYRSYIGKQVKQKKKVRNPTVTKCPYCKNNFAKSEGNMKSHIRTCAAKEGIAYYFNNGEIIHFQDNFKYLGDAPFTAYFDFETTTVIQFFIQKYLL